MGGLEARLFILYSKKFLDSQKSGGRGREAGRSGTSMCREEKNTATFFFMMEMLGFQIDG